MKNFDVVVIGAGPAGYVAALRAATKGMKVACVEKEATLGGTCLNVGCIPSKSLLYSTELYHKIASEGKEHGISASTLSYDLSKMMKRKDDVVEGLVKGIAYLFDKRQVTWLKGVATVAADHILVGGEKIGFKHLILATGSVPIELPSLKFDETHILSSTGALALKQVPKKMLLVGAGVIGLELGSVYARLGAEVEVVELMDRVTPPFDCDVSKALLAIFRKQGFSFHLGAKVEKGEVKQGKVALTIDSGATLQGDVVLVAVGRKPLLPEGLTFERLPSGQLKVDDHFQTSHPNIYAIGDLIDGPMLAHKASEEAMVLVDALAGSHSAMDYMAIPNVMYTWPEVASVGLTEERAHELKLTVVTGKAPFKAISRARCSGEMDGFVKVIGEKVSKRLLGVHIVGAHASEMIGEAVCCIKQKMSLLQLAHLPHAHPTLAEGLKEAALDSLDEPLHF